MAHGSAALLNLFQNPWSLLKSRHSFVAIPSNRHVTVPLSVLTVEYGN